MAFKTERWNSLIPILEKLEWWLLPDLAYKYVIIAAMVRPSLLTKITADKKKLNTYRLYLY